MFVAHTLFAMMSSSLRNIFLCLLTVMIKNYKADIPSLPVEGNVVRVLGSNRLQNPHDSCISFEGHSACYDEQNTTHSNSYYKAFMAIKNTLEDDLDIQSGALHSCKASVKRTAILNNENMSLSILLIRPNSCKSPGNTLGFFYEAISFGLANGYIIGRLDPRTDDNCDIAEETGKLETYFPRLIIPKTLNISPLNLDHCNTLDEWPWQNPQSHFWGASELLGNINKKMMKEYSSANVPSKNSSETVGIHYRCGDNIQDHGVFPFSAYKSILKKIALDPLISRFVIYTEVDKHGFYGQLCWNLLGELQQTIKNTEGFRNADIVINYSSPSHAMSMLHMSKVIICSVSTFCFFSSLGSNVVYQPGPVSLFGYPKVNCEISHRGRIFFKSKLLRPNDFPSLSAANFTHLVVSS